MKLVNLVGFIKKKFVKMHDHMNVKRIELPWSLCGTSYSSGRVALFLAQCLDGKDK